MRCCSLRCVSRSATTSSRAAITRAMISASAGMSRSTSAGVKYRSDTRNVPEPAGDEDRVDFLRPVHAARERQLDVGGAAGTGDEVDDGAAARPVVAAAVVPRLERHARLLECLDERR